jgi:hypothetical protein
MIATMMPQEPEPHADANADVNGMPSDVIGMGDDRGPRDERRTRLILAGGAIAAVIAVTAGFFVVKAGRDTHVAGRPAAGAGATVIRAAPSAPSLSPAAVQAIVAEVTTVPASTLDAVAGGPGVVSYPMSIHRVSGPPLTARGKPELFYDGALYCPFCASERWAMIVALSRFGTFSGLRLAYSSATDSPASIATWTFYRSSYTSKYLTFTPVEETTSVPDGNGSYARLQTPTAAQRAVITRYNSQGSIPFLDYGNKYVQVGDLPVLEPQNLQGQAWAQIAAALKDPSSPTAQAVDSAANWTTAAICDLTRNQPATACTPAVKALEPRLRQMTLAGGGHFGALAAGGRQHAEDRVNRRRHGLQRGIIGERPGRRRERQPGVHRLGDRAQLARELADCGRRWQGSAAAQRHHGRRHRLQQLTQGHDAWPQG